MLKKFHWVLQQNLWLITIVVLGAILRFWSIGFGLPYLYHPDEGVPLRIALTMVRTGDLNPHFFDWPSLLFYLNALLYVGLFAVGKLLGWFATPTDLPMFDNVTMAVGHVELPVEMLLGRGLDALIGTLSILLVYLICRRLTHTQACGLIAAFWFAVETNSVRESQFIRPDTLLVLCVLVCIYFALKILDEPLWRNYVFAGIAAGLATSSKYNAVLCVVAIALAHGLRMGWRGIARREIWMAALASVVAFFATTPFALFDWNHFWSSGVLGNAAHYAGEHEGSVGNSFVWYLEFLATNPSGVWLLALGGCALLLSRRDRKGMVLLIFPVTYLIFIGLFPVHFVTLVLPVIPFVLILGAFMLERALEYIAQRQMHRRHLYGISLSIMILFLGLPPFVNTVTYDQHILEPDNREMARVWLENNLPLGARIAVEPYSPYLARDKFMVEGVDGMTSHSPQWYLQNGFEYLVFSYGTYGRFYEHPDQYPEIIQKYESLFAEFPEVKRFNVNGFEIRIHKTNVQNLPMHRVAARFGIYADWLELVGYDLKSTQAVQPIDVILFWRVLQARREPLTLNVRLLDRNDNEITRSTEPLFKNIEPSFGILRVPLTISAPTEPGVYRLELSIDAGNQGRIPVLSRQKEPVADKLFLAPFKIAPMLMPPQELQSARTINARFGEAIELKADTLQQTSDVVRVTLFWQCVAKPAKAYTVFVHLIDTNGNMLTQADSEPQGGAYPTTLWDAGEIVRDEYVLALRDLPPGEYQIEIGMYTQPSLERLPVNDSDHLLLPDRIKVAR